MYRSCQLWLKGACVCVCVDRYAISHCCYIDLYMILKGNNKLKTLFKPCEQFWSAQNLRNEFGFTKIIQFPKWASCLCLSLEQNASHATTSCHNRNPPWYLKVEGIHDHWHQGFQQRPCRIWSRPLGSQPQCSQRFPAVFGSGSFALFCLKNAKMVTKSF